MSRSTNDEARSAWDEDKVSRSGDGRFAPKVSGESGVELAPAVRLTPQQEAALAHLERNPRSSVAAIIEAAGIRGWDDNQGKFLTRLVNTGQAGLVAGDRPERAPTAKQRAALDRLASRPDSSVDALVDAAGVSGGDDNRATFVLRMLRGGHLRLVPRRS